MNNGNFNFYNLGKGIYFKISSFLGFFYCLFLIFLSYSFFNYLESASDIKEFFSLINFLIVFVTMVASVFFPILAGIFLGIELFWCGKIHLEPEGKNIILEILFYIFFLVFQVFLVTNVFMFLYLMSKSIFAVFFIVLFFICFYLIIYYSGVQKRERLSRLKDFKKYYKENINSKKENSIAVIISAIIITLFLFHYGISGFMLINEDRGQKNNQFQSQNNNFFNPEKIFFEKFILIKNN